MNEEIVPRKKTIKYMHVFFGVVILISGIIFGFLAGAYTVGHHMDFFRPPPKKIQEDISSRIVRDFPAIKGKQAELSSILNEEFKQFSKLNEEVSFRILQLQHSVALKVKEMLPDQKDRKRWMEDFPDYFPGHKHRLFRAKKFGKRQKINPDDCMLSDWERCPPPPPPAD